MNTRIVRFIALAFSALLAAPAVAQEPSYSEVSLLRETPVTIPVDYTPFGNRISFNRFGDDGSACLLDANGVLTWLDRTGAMRLLPDTSLAIPLLVTNTECLVWSNRFVDHADYPSRPSAELTLFRASLGGGTVTSTTVNVNGKEIIPTPVTTTSTNPLVFITSERVEYNGIRVGPLLDLSVAVLRVYRLTFNGTVQLLRAIPTFDIEDSFSISASGPNVDVLATGSDGSWLFRVQDAAAGQVTFWVDSQGREIILDDDSWPPDRMITRGVFASQTRVVVQDDVGDIYDFRRSSASGLLVPGTPTTIVGITGNLIDFSNESKFGETKFFYTTEQDVPASGQSRVRIYQLGDTSATELQVANLPSLVANAITVASINPRDGSAVVVSEDGSEMFWLHVGGDGFTPVPDTNEAFPLFVTDEQVLVWDNALAPTLGDGSIAPAVLKHYQRDVADLSGVIPVDTDVIVEGTTLLNTNRFTPEFEFWQITTAQKTTASTVLLRTYQINEPTLQDTDNDGIPDIYETNTGVYVSPVDTGTDPLNPDTDGDGISDGGEREAGTDPTDEDDPLKDQDSDNDGVNDYRELFVFNSNPNRKDTDKDGLKDAEEVRLGSNLNRKDTDRDGISDGDEVNITLSDPTKPSTGSMDPGKKAIPFGRSQVRGDYEGIVVSSRGGQTFKQTMRLSGGRGFSAKLNGLRENTSFKGRFSKRGLYTSNTDINDDLRSVRMLVVRENKSRHVIQGTYNSRKGGEYYFQLQKVVSGKEGWQQSLRLTLDTPKGKGKGPKGSLVGVGRLRNGGSMSANFYLPDGSRSSFNAPVLRGDRVSLLARSNSSSRPTLMGMLQIRKVKNSSDFDGEIRMFSPGDRKGNLFPGGYDQQRTVLGGYYRGSSSGALPLSGFKAKANNARLQWKGGQFSGVRKAGTWTSDGKLNVPTNQSDSIRTAFVPKTGLLKVTYRRTDPDLDLQNDVAHSVAVVQQAKDSFRGYYLSDSSANFFDVVPNRGDNKVNPDVFVVTPRSREVRAAATTYTITVETNGDWTVDLPLDAPWVTAVVTSGNITGPAESTIANGNGTVTVTVEENTTLSRRETSFLVAGVQHKLQQEFR